MAARIDRYVIPVLVGFAPVALALLTWGPNGLTQAQENVRLDAAPVFAVELVTFIIALRQGLVAWLRDNMPPALAIAALAMWVVVAIATALMVAPDSVGALRWTLHWIVHLLFGFSIAFLARRLFRIGDLIRSYLAGFVVYCLIFLAFLWLYWGRPIDWVHNLPGALHVRHVGIYAAAMTGMSIGLLADTRNRGEWICAFAIATVGFALGWWTGSRGMVVSVVGATLLGAILMRPMRKIRVLGGAALSLAIAIPAVAWLPVPDSKMMGVARAVAATTQHEMTTGRVGIWANAMHAIALRPIFGYGAGQLSIVAPFYETWNAHNLILQILVDWGFVGLGCVLVAAFFYGKRAIPVLAAEGTPLDAPLITALSLLLLSMIDAAMYDVFPVSIFTACAGLIASQPRPAKASAPS